MLIKTFSHPKVTASLLCTVETRNICKCLLHFSPVLYCEVSSLILRQDMAVSWPRFLRFVSVAPGKAWVNASVEAMTGHFFQFNFAVIVPTFDII